METPNEFTIRPATVDDTPVLLSLIKGLAEYENLSDEVTATEDDLRRSLFGPRPTAEALIAYADAEPVGIAVFFPGAVAARKTRRPRPDNVSPTSLRVARPSAVVARVNQLLNIWRDIRTDPTKRKFMQLKSCHSTLNPIRCMDAKKVNRSRRKNSNFVCRNLDCCI